jgi:hypothetical protein
MIETPLDFKKVQIQFPEQFSPISKAKDAEKER